jgi:hypothetical protein
MLAPVWEEVLINVLIQTCLHGVQIVKLLDLPLGSWQSVLSNSDASFFYAARRTVILHCK